METRSNAATRFSSDRQPEDDKRRNGYKKRSANIRERSTLRALLQHPFLFEGEEGERELAARFYKVKQEKLTNEMFIWFQSLMGLFKRPESVKEAYQHTQATAALMNQAYGPPAQTIELSRPSTLTIIHDATEISGPPDESISPAV